MLRCLPIFKGCARTLDTYEKTHCGLESVPDDVVRSGKTLEECYLDANQIVELPRGFFRLQRLRILSLSDNALSRIPMAFGNLSQLVVLDLSRNDLTEVAENIKFCTLLQNVDLSSNPLQKLPDGFSTLQNLTILNLNDISLSVLPQDFGNLSNLQRLEMRDNLLKTLPSSFSRLAKLEFLDMGANEFSELPALIGQLTSLTDLTLDNNELLRLPQEVGRLARLQLLDVSENFLEELPEELGQCESLTDLILSQNSLDSLPNSIGQLRSLTHLKVDANRLVVLTSHIGKCGNLQDLYLTENLLSTLPTSVGNLVKLINLNVDRNRLNELPVEIGRCSRLNILFARDNRLRRLPCELGLLKQLHVLDVAGNKLDRLPITLSQCPLKALWLAENQARPTIKLQKDVDEWTSEPFLTCYLLPQEAFETESMENFMEPTLPSSGTVPARGAQPAAALSAEPGAPNALPAGVTVAEPGVASPAAGDTAPPPAAAPPEANGVGLGLTIGSRDNSASAAHLAVVGPAAGVVPPASGPGGPGGVGMGQGPGSRPTSELVDHDEVHAKPKEPKLRHRFDKRAVDGHVIHKDPTGAKEKVFAPGRASPPTVEMSLASEAELVNEIRQSRLRKISAYGDTNAAPASPHRPPDSMDAVTGPARSAEAPPDLRSRSKSDTTPPVQHQLNINTNSSVGPLTASTVPGAIRRPPTEQPSAPAAAPAKKDVKKDTKKATSSSSSESDSDDSSSDSSSSETSRSRTSSATSAASSAASGPKKAAPGAEKKAPAASAPVAGKPALVVSGEPRGGPGAPPPEKVKKSVKMSEEAPVAVTIREPVMSEPLREEDEEMVDADAVSSGGEEIDNISRHVGFSEDVEDNEEKSASANGKLFRRDTPHYTKRARIKDGAENEQVVLKILEKYRTPSGGSNTSGGSAAAMLAAMGGTGSEGPLPMSAGSVAPGGDMIRPQASLASYAAQPGHPGPLGGAVSPLDTREEEHRIVIVRSPHTGLGISIAGGLGSVPYRGTDQGIFISKVSESSPAFQAGLQVGDKLLEVNGKNMVEVEHQVAVDALRSAGQRLELRVSREEVITPAMAATAAFDENMELQQERIMCPLERDENGLGFSIAGGRGSLPRNMNDERWSFLESIYISKITEGGAADKCGLLKVGDRIVKINNIDVNEARHDQAVALLTGNEPRVELEVLREHVVPKQGAGPDASATAAVASPATASAAPAPAPTPATATATATANGAPSAATNGHSEVPAPAPFPEETVCIIKSRGPLGFSVCGGSDHSSHPFGVSEPGVFISKIVAHGAASRTALRVGDRILSVNERDLRRATHNDAVQALVEPQTLKLRVRHDPPPRGLLELTLSKRPGEKLGVSIKGGVGGAPANPVDPSDEGIFVTRVTADGAVARDGRIRPGHRLLEVNGASLLGATHQEAVRILRLVSDSMTVMLCDGFDPALLGPRLGTTPVTAGAVGVSGAGPGAGLSPEERHGVKLRPRLESSTSVDREDEVQSLVLQEGDDGEAGGAAAEVNVTFPKVDEEAPGDAKRPSTPPRVPSNAPPPASKPSTVVEAHQVPTRPREWKPSEYQTRVSASRYMSSSASPANDPILASRYPGGRIKPASGAGKPVGASSVTPPSSIPVLRGAGGIGGSVTVPNNSISSNTRQQQQPPSASLSLSASTKPGIEGERMTFTQKRRYFEDEIRRASTSDGGLEDDSVQCRPEQSQATVPQN